MIFAFDRNCKLKVGGRMHGRPYGTLKTQRQLAHRALSHWTITSPISAWHIVSNVKAPIRNGAGTGLGCSLPGAKIHDQCLFAKCFCSPGTWLNAMTWAFPQCCMWKVRNTSYFFLEHVIKHNLTIVPEFHSHLEQMSLLPLDTLKDQISFSYSKGKNGWNVINVPGFDTRYDPTR